MSADLQRDFRRFVAPTSDAPVGIEVDRATGSTIVDRSGRESPGRTAAALARELAGSGDGPGAFEFLWLLGMRTLSVLRGETPTGPEGPTIVVEPAV